MNSFVLVAAGGALGASARYGLGLIALRSLGPTAFPWGTLSANALGGVLMGVLIQALIHLPDGLLGLPAREARLVLGVGLLGGFTTFSAFSLEVFLMLERRDWLLAFGYVSASLIASIGGLALGILLMRRVLA